MGHGFHARERSKRQSGKHQPKLVAVVARRHLDHHGAAARRARRALPRSTTRCSMSTPPPRSAAYEFETDAWQLDVASAGLQKCLAGPSGSAPLTSQRARRTVITAPQAHRSRDSRRRATKDGDGPLIRSQLLRPRHDHGLLVRQARSTTTPRRPPCSTRRANARASCSSEGLEQAFARHARAARRAARGPRGHGAEALRRSARTRWPT